GSGWNDTVYADTPGAKHQESYFNGAGPGYFRTMGTAMLAGRDFDDRDLPKSTKVAVVNEAFVKRFLADGSPVGRVFRVEGRAGEADPMYQVIGVVRNTTYYELREDFLPIAFVAASQADEPDPHVMF